MVSVTQSVTVVASMVSLTESATKVTTMVSVTESATEVTTMVAVTESATEVTTMVSGIKPAILNHCGLLVKAAMVILTTIVSVNEQAVLKSPWFLGLNQ
jgi:hypothetical protein